MFNHRYVLRVHYGHICRVKLDIGTKCEMQKVKIIEYSYDPYLTAFLMGYVENEQNSISSQIQKWTEKSVSNVNNSFLLKRNLMNVSEAKTDLEKRLKIFLASSNWSQRVKKKFRVPK